MRAARDYCELFVSGLGVVSESVSPDQPCPLSCSQMSCDISPRPAWGGVSGGGELRENLGWAKGWRVKRECGLGRGLGG